MEESEAIRAARAGDSAGFAALVALHQVRALRAAYVITRDRHLAEDMTQEAFVRAFQAIGRCDPGRPFAPWFMRILINLCRTAVSRRSRQTLVAQLPDTGAPDPAVGGVEDRVLVWQALQRLNPIHRDVLMLRYYLDFSETETAEALDIPTGTAKSRLHKARQLLEQALGEAGVGGNQEQEVLS